MVTSNKGHVFKMKPSEKKIRDWKWNVRRNEENYTWRWDRQDKKKNE